MGAVKRFTTIALATIILLGSAYWYLIADRSLSSLQSATIGTPIDQATNDLRKSGYLAIRPSNSDRSKSSCDDFRTYYFAKGSDPSFTYTISVDEDCKISSIRRTRRGLEL
ncbi:hypothetical protein [Erythrobacter sp. THAF29]|uniref:hypothetical protein n=1 Tax=Erythrobacter sp. THAF29 TaxID=2587851 RepID=UPI00126853D7|nr:hypothetical protein [Erythrobacter sp. THAF29]QFT77631.1 hypothetical protein FIU90_08775 [Erythrobacter sp. THAF29]